MTLNKILVILTVAMIVTALISASVFAFVIMPRETAASALSSNTGPAPTVTTPGQKQLSHQRQQ